MGLLNSGASDKKEKFCCFGSLSLWDLMLRGGRNGKLRRFCVLIFDVSDKKGESLLTRASRFLRFYVQRR